jgi:pyruvate/2-oxoglutarate dehydrogenase complex dihydrolipoamide dehydrogenase (E3) component
MHLRPYTYGSHAEVSPPGRERSRDFVTINARPLGVSARQLGMTTGGADVYPCFGIFDRHDRRTSLIDRAGCCELGGPSRVAAFGRHVAGRSGLGLLDHLTIVMTRHFDAIIIGTGQAGPFVAQRLAAAGMHVAIIERKLFGGTCVNTGCIPTKAMVASAYAAHIARRAAVFGVAIEGAVSVDMRRVKARKDAISGKSRNALEISLKEMKNGTVYEGHARFESPREVSVGAERLAADRIFINVGGRAIVPQMPGLEQVEYLTNSSMMEVDFLPRHLIIVGGSYVGLEFGQMFRRFGSEVSIIEMGPRLIHREDEDVSATVKEILEAEEINVRLNAKCIRVSRRSDQEIIAHADCATGDLPVGGTHLLLAVGRRPNTDDLGLERAGVTVDERGYIVVDDQLRTSVPGIWALGDCNGKGGFTHTSFNDAEIVAANLLDNDPRRVSDRIPAYALYIDPPLGRAGLTEAEVRKTGRPALLGKCPMTKVARAVEKGETQGFMKILVDAQTHEILGAAILGTGGDEVIHSILDVMYARAPYTVIRRAMHIHPTVSELIPTMLGELQPLAG